MTYKNYSLKQLENFLYDAMGAAEATPQEIYDVIHGAVENNYYTYKVQASQAYELLALLNGNGKGHVKAYDDCMPPWGHSDLEYASKYPKEDKPKTWILPVDDEGVVTLPEDLLERSGWKEGDTLVYEVCNGCVIVRKKEPMTYDEMISAGYTMTDDGFWILNSEPFGFNEVSTGELIDSPKFQEEQSKKNTRLESLNSPEMVKMREDLAQAHKDSIDKSVGWYYNLSEEDKYCAVEALCNIICKAECKGTSHRGLQSILGLYPQAFWIDGLMEIHNSLYTYYQEDESRAWGTFPHEELDKEDQTSYNDDVPTEVQ